MYVCMYVCIYTDTGQYSAVQDRTVQYTNGGCESVKRYGMSARNGDLGFERVCFAESAKVWYPPEMGILRVQRYSTV